MMRVLIAILLTLAVGTSANAADKPRVTVGSKAFTESSILGDIVALVAEREGCDVRHKKQIGGTQLVWQGLLRGEIDIYPDYTGTIAQEILKNGSGDLDTIRNELAKQNVIVSKPLGFVNPYALGMRRETAEKLGITTISDLRDHPELKFGFSNEFMQRSDGWPSLKQRYALPHAGGQVRGLSHALAYEGMKGEKPSIHVTDTFLTDAKIKQHDLVLLKDDLQHFPAYETVLVYRADLAERAPQLVSALDKLAGSISNDKMLALNSRVELDHISDRQAAGEFLNISVARETLWQRLWRTTLGHLFLVVTSLSAAIVVAVPLGVLAAKRRKLEHPILITVELIQTIPGLALLVLLMPPISAIGLSAIGPAPAIVALFLYSLLPIIRNTHTGITGIPGNIRESAEAIGLSPWAQLWQVELPMASRLILAGIKTTAVINVGYATLGGLIGAGGYGQPINEGLAQSNRMLMLEGAIPAAIMAIAVKYLFELGERFVVPKGLRFKGGH
jgi:osmoprotectant transport system permease protein